MQEWLDFIQKLALLISAITGLATIYFSMRKFTHDEKKEKHDESNDDAEMYRKRWLAAEEGFDDLYKENAKLREKISTLENQIEELKQKIQRLRNRGK
ncbi:hypothetical protein [Lactobacillus hominis]|uniref:hypothetical protein n=1 Tax=Lactobacillus hominis TaxID=1203033 RepID=UPI000312E733|nr:hypothetical protein [Lactobacillus hominis]MCT3347222.1 hypothetical protein [Lactobacillus hominis]